jgi:hypothetical protein
MADYVEIDPLSLVDGAYEVAVDLAASEPSTHEIILVAPNPEIKRLWEKQYPGINVYLSEKVPVQSLPSPAHFDSVRRYT